MRHKMSMCGSCKLYDNGCEGDLCIGECAETLQDYICDILVRAEAAEARAKKAEKERDAAVSDLRGCAIESCAECMYCLYRTAKSFCWNCTDGSNWKWKGQKEE